MNKYYCTKCNKEKIIRSEAKELSVKCCDGVEPTLHKIGNAPLKPSIKVKPPGNIPVKPSASAKITKLDQPAGDIKITHSMPSVPSASSEEVISNVVTKPSPPDKLP